MVLFLQCEVILNLTFDKFAEGKPHFCTFYEIFTVNAQKPHKKAFIFGIDP